MTKSQGEAKIIIIIHHKIIEYKKIIIEVILNFYDSLNNLQ